MQKDSDREWLFLRSCDMKLNDYAKFSLLRRGVFACLLWLTSNAIADGTYHVILQKNGVANPPGLQLELRDVIWSVDDSSSADEAATAQLGTPTGLLTYSVKSPSRAI